MENIIETFKNNEYIKIYKKLGDELSKFIYRERVLYSVTGDYTHIYNIVTHSNGDTLQEWESKRAYQKALKWYQSTLNEIEELKQKANEENRKIIICGALSGYGKKLSKYFGGDILCDKNAKGTPLLSTLEAVSRYPDGMFLVASPFLKEEIIKELEDMGIKRWNIAYLDCREPRQLLIDWGYSSWKRDLELCEKESYFDEYFLYHDENEVFVDCGFFDSETSRTFLEWCNYKYNKIIAFEPDEKLYENYKLSNDIRNLELYNAGCWDKSGTLHFKEEQGGSSFVVQDGDVKIDVLAIDEVLNGEKATFIKMDIEGSELNALKGAKGTIQKFHPKLAICIYHKPEDIIEIPKYILSLYEGYTFYIRHYEYNECGTILYAVDYRNKS